MLSFKNLRAVSRVSPKLVRSTHHGEHRHGVELPQALANIGSKVFDPKKRLTGDLLNAYNEAVTKGTQLDKKSREAITKQVQDWAFSQGAVNFSHWFSATRGSHAEKHDSMIDLNFSTGDIKVELSHSRLFQGETDGSSFPNGGLRATHRAAAYMGWDLTSPPFVRGDTLFVPSSFITYNGDPLDDKTPLLRSQEAINESGLRLLRALGDKTSQGVVSNTGWEQEFFVIDRDQFQRRPDLISVGRTLLGALPHRGQQTEAHYFARPPPRIRAFLRECQSELWALGLSMNTYHNEVAPSQHEFSPIFSVCSKAADHNSLSMEILHEVAARHGLCVLTHEKPFARINGSGKHNNWGLNTDTGDNLFVPGKTVEEQRRFVTFVAALTRTISVHGDILRVGVATAGNDHRLGAQEAPPAIISLYTGELMEQHLRGVVNGGPMEGYTRDSRDLTFGTRAVQNITAGKEDRNRTAPFPFCGNRFEFRAVGGNQNIAFPLALLNTAMADSMSEMAAQVEKGKNPREAVAATLKDHFHAIFNGNGYSEEWQIEAKKRGLPNMKNTPDAIPRLTDPKNKALFTKFKVFTEAGLEARADVMYHDYIETIQMEATTLLEMMYTGVIPACLEDVSKSAALSTASPHVRGYLNRKAELAEKVVAATDALKKAHEAFPKDGSNADQAVYARDVIKAQMAAVRSVTDEAEKIVTHSLWPFPKYDELLYSHHPESEFDGY